MRSEPQNTQLPGWGLQSLLPVDDASLLEMLYFHWREIYNDYGQWPLVLSKAIRFGTFLNSGILHMSRRSC